MMRSLLEDEATSHGYTQSQLNTIELANLSASIVSLIASTFVILNYFAISSLRRQLSYKLILWVAVSDLLYAIGNCLGVPKDNPLCIIQGILLQFAAMSSIFWVVAISWTIDHLMNAAKLPTRAQLKRILLMMHIIIWTLSAITTILPLFTNTYGPAGGWCWFENKNMIDTIWRYALFYGWLWLSIIYMIFIYIKTWAKIKAMNKILAEDEEQEPKSLGSGTSVGGLSVGGGTGISDEQIQQVEMKTIHSDSDIKDKRKEKEKQKKRSNALNRMIFFPLVLIIGYLFASIRRIIDLSTDNAPFWLALTQVLFMSLIPFFDAVVYGLTKDVRKKDKEYLQKWCGCCGDNDVA